MRRTKIIATVGPASQSETVVRHLLAAGVDVFRLNFSHGTHESHAATFGLIRAAAASAGRQVAVMQDLSGPKIRTGPVAGEPIPLVDGQELRIAAGDRPAEPGRVYTLFQPLIEAAGPGDRLLLDDGRIELQVIRREGGELVTGVVAGGPLGGRKGINAPGVPLPPCAITDKDERDLRFGVRLGVDFAAVSFVQTAGDVRRAMEVSEAAGRRLPIIAKVERPAAVQNLEGILEVAQGVMVARGDLGLELPLERIPRIQREIIRQSRSAGRPVIVATQVLESMRTEPRPTRAEVSDAANVVNEGADAIMLAGETAVGAYPVRAVETLHRIVSEAEAAALGAERIVPLVDPAWSRHGRALCEAAVTLASAGQADAIVAVTREGKTARFLAALRPPAPVLAATADSSVAAALCLFWGVTPLVTPTREREELEAFLLERRLLSPASTVVYINVSPDLTRADANFLNVQRIG